MEGFTVELENEDDLFHWIVWMEGPPGKFEFIFTCTALVWDEKIDASHSNNLHMARTLFLTLAHFRAFIHSQFRFTLCWRGISTTTTISSRFSNGPTGA